MQSPADPVPVARETAHRFARRAATWCLLLLGLAPWPARAQFELDEPLLPETISEHDVEMRGRYASQWREGETIVVLFTGGFRLDMGQRHLSANRAVVWITPRRSDPADRQYYELAVYLSGQARVEDLGGTTAEDRALLVTNLLTYGRVIKAHDAHASGVGEESPLYQEAVRDRARIDASIPATPAPRRPIDVARPAEGPATPPEPRVIRYELPRVDPVRTAAGELVYVAARTRQRRVYLSRTGGPDEPMLELLADSAVVFPAEGFSEGLLSASDVAGAGVLPEAAPPTVPEVAPPTDDGEQDGMLPGVGRTLRGVYLEGDVFLSLGSSSVRAHRIYYDFQRDRALILDAVFRADIPERGIPLYVRAERIRQLSASEFAAENARITTSEFHTPHYHVGAERIYLRDLTPRDAAGRALRTAQGEYEIENATLNVETVPLLWWPYAKGRFDASETGLRSFRIGYSGDFGTEVETEWYLLQLLGLEEPEGFDTRWKLDYFTDRGPATGVDVDYERPTHFGLLRSYYIHDHGEDNLGPLRRAEEEPEDQNRGRVLWRHRHYLPDDWEATFEVSFIDDPNFLEEYYPSEFYGGKDQETLFQLKHTGETDAFTFLTNWRLLDFVTQTEHLPEIAYRRIGDTFAAPFVLYHESRIGAVRYRLDDRRAVERHRFSNLGESDLTFRTDLRQEIELPLKVGPANFVPFATFRASTWDSQPLDDGALWRGMGIYGVRGSTVFSRVFDDVDSDLLDIHRVRHIVKPDFAAWWAHSNTRSRVITPFDYGIETIDDFYGVTAGIRQTWQTKRGPADAARTVDFLTFNVEVGFFGDAAGRNNPPALLADPFRGGLRAEDSNGWANPLRPENSRTRNYFAGDLIYRLSDTTTLLYDFNIDLDDWSSDRQNVSIAVERLPRLAYVFGYRHAGDIDMDLIGGGWNYKLSEKHSTTVRAWYDIDRGDVGEISAGYVRKLPRWYLATVFEYDRIDDDFTISLAIWPEGIPEWTLGSRRFSGLGSSTSLRP